LKKKDFEVFYYIYIGGGGVVDDGAEFEVTQDGEITH